MHLNDVTVDTTSPGFTIPDTITFPSFNINFESGTQTAAGSTFDWGTPSVPYTVFQPANVQTTPVSYPNPSVYRTPVTATPATSVAPSLPATVASPSTQQAQQTQAQSGDWVTRNVVPLVQAGVLGWAAYNQYEAQQAALQSRLPAGVSSTYPSSTLSTGPLTASQVAALTPAQQQAYYALYPAANPATSSLSTGLSIPGLGNIDMTTMLMIGGGALLLIMLMKGKKEG